MNNRIYWKDKNEVDNTAKSSYFCIAAAEVVNIGTLA